MSEKYSKRRLVSSSITMVISLTLVLFMVGLLAIISLNATKLSDKVKENIGVMIILKDDAKEVNVKRLTKTLDAKRYVKSTRFVTEDEALAKVEEMLGEDAEGILDYNPLSASISVHMDAEYANNDSLDWIEKELLENKSVKEVSYRKSLISKVNKNMNKITIVILIFSAFFMIIALALINNTIRLSIYSKRFIIRTMLLVGATQGFIQRPFVLKGIRHGVYASIMAIAMLVGLLYYAQNEIPDLRHLQDEKMIATLFGVVVLIGIIISWFSTAMAVRKYLRMKPESLYY